MNTPAPAITIVLEFERRTPIVRCCYGNDGEQARMLDWLDQQPRLVVLLASALELERAA